MNVLVYTNFALGDIILATPCVSMLYDAGCNITFLCEEIGRDIIEGDWIEVITYNRLAAQIPERNRIKKILQNRKFDAVVLTVPGNNLDGSFIFSDKDKNFLYHYEDEWPMRFLNHTADLNGALSREVLKKGIFTPLYRLAEIPRINSPKTNNVIMHIGPQNSFFRYKAFPLTFYKEIIAFLRSNGFMPKIVGDTKQKVYAQMFRGLAEDCTCLPLEETKQLMLDAFAFIGNDCGPAHLASALQLPTITFYGPTRYLSTGPWPISERNLYIQGEVSCGPCAGTIGITTCNKPICHEKITFGDFKEKWKQLLLCRQKEKSAPVAEQKESLECLE